MKAVPIYLTGFMCAGKSQLGTALAKELQRPFIDLDRHIEKYCGCSIAELFSRKGEKYFRKLEAKLLKDLDPGNAVVATGGGTPCFFDSLEIMNERGITVFIEVEIKELLQRIKEDQANRPMVKGLDDDRLELKVLYLLYERAPFYRKAKVDWNPAQETIKTFSRRLKSQLK